MKEKQHFAHRANTFIGFMLVPLHFICITIGTQAFKRIKLYRIECMNAERCWILLVFSENIVGLSPHLQVYSGIKFSGYFSAQSYVLV